MPAHSAHTKHLGCVLALSAGTKHFCTAHPPSACSQQHVLVGNAYFTYSLLAHFHTLPISTSATSQHTCPVQRRLASLALHHWHCTWPLLTLSAFLLLLMILLLIADSAALYYSIFQYYCIIRIYYILSLNCLF